MKFLQRAFLLIVWCCGAAMAAPTDLIAERAWVEDPTGRMTLEQVRQVPEHALATSHFNQGYSSSAFWIRLRIDPARIAPDESDERLILRISPPTLDELQLFDPLHPGAQPQITGDRHPQKANDYRSLNLNFVLLRSQAPRDVWLRLTTTSSTLMHVQVFTESEAKALDWSQAIASTAYIGTLVICLGWAALAWLLLRDHLIRYYIAREVVAVLYAMISLGAFRALAWESLAPAWIDGISNFIACWILATVVWFDTALLAQYRAHFAALWALRAGVLLSALSSVMTLLGLTPLAFKLNSWVAILSPVLLFVTAFTAKAWTEATEDTPPDFPRWALACMYLIMPIALFLNRAVLNGWIPPIVTGSQAALVYMLFGSIMMMVLLQMRAFRARQRQQEVHLRLRLAEQHVQEERDRREEQARFLSMLTHELKTPLAVARISLDDSPLAGPQRQRIDRALGNINGIIERCMVNDRLENQKLKPQLQACKLQSLLDECVQGCSDPSRVKVSERNEVFVRTDSELLAICLANLIDNALKYSPAVPPIDVRMQPDPAGIAIKVRNAIGAAGVPDPQQLYTKYYRSPGALSKSGSGLGLYLTRHLATLLGGQVTHRVDGEYVEFCLWLPA